MKIEDIMYFLYIFVLSIIESWCFYKLFGGGGKK